MAAYSEEAADRAVYDWLTQGGTSDPSITPPKLLSGAFLPVNVAAPTGVAATDTAVLNAALTAAATGGVVRMPAGTYIVTPGSLVVPATNFLQLIGNGRGSTTIKAAAGAAVVITLTAGGLHQRFEGFTVDGNSTATRGIYAPDNAGVGATYRDLEITGCAMGFENADRAYSATWWNCKFTNNTSHVKLIKRCQNTKFYGGTMTGSSGGACILGDDSSTIANIEFHGVDVEHAAGAQDNFLVKRVSPLVIVGGYSEAPVAGSAHVHIAGTAPSTVEVKGISCAGGSAATSPFKIDSGADSVLNYSGCQINGFTGALVTDASTTSRVTQDPGVTDGSLTATLPSRDFGGQLLKIVSYDPTGTFVTAATTSSTPADIDATNLAITFVAPASGKVLVKLSAVVAGSGNTQMLWSLREASSGVGAPMAMTITGGTSRPMAPILITGLTPGSSHTYKWAHANGDNSTSISTQYGGDTTNSRRGAAVMEVWSVPT